MQGSSHQRLSQYGRYQTSFSGRVEVEDRQPNESLSGRKNGPPALMTTVVAIGRLQGGGRGRRVGHSGPSFRGRGPESAQHKGGTSLSATAGPSQQTCMQRGGKRQASADHSPPMKKHKSQHEYGTPREEVLLRSVSSSGQNLKSSFVTPPPRTLPIRDFTSQSGKVPASSLSQSLNFISAHQQTLYPTSSPSNFCDISRNSTLSPGGLPERGPPMQNWLAGGSEPGPRFSDVSRHLLQGLDWAHDLGFSRQAHPLPRKLMTSTDNSSHGTAAPSMEYTKLTIPLADHPPRESPPPPLPVPLRKPELANPVPLVFTPASQIPSPVMIVKHVADEQAPVASGRKETRLSAPARPTVAPGRSEDVVLASIAKSLLPTVKEEPDTMDIDTIPEASQRRLITARSERYEWPENCKKSDSGWQQNRRAFMKVEVKLLERKRLTVKKRLFRDDGMVLEWISPIPLWDDTLLPEDKYTSVASAINSSASPEQLKFTEAIRNGTPPPRSPTPSKSRPVSQASSRESSSQPAKPSRVVRPSQRDLPLPQSPKRRFKPVQGSKLRHVQGPASSKAVSSSPPPEPREAPAEDQVSQELRDGGFENAEPARKVKALTKSVNFPPLPPRRRRRSLANGTASVISQDGNTSLTGASECSPNFWFEVPECKAFYYDNRVSCGGEDANVTLAKAFITKYLRHFDKDRAFLDMAYTTNATFSCSTHLVNGPVGMTELFCCQTSPSGYGHEPNRASFVRGRTKVVDSLLCLGPYLLEYDGSKLPMYDVTTRMTATSNGLTRDVILLTVHGDAVNNNTGTGEDHVLSVDQTFLLCRPEDLEDWEKVEEVSGSGWGFTSTQQGEGNQDNQPWPLLAISHQMVVRDKPTLFLGRLVEEEPWIEGLTSLAR